jgi:hypothetical protein
MAAESLDNEKARAIRHVADIASNGIEEAIAILKECDGAEARDETVMSPPVSLSKPRLPRKRWASWRSRRTGGRKRQYQGDA